MIPNNSMTKTGITIANSSAAPPWLLRKRQPLSHTDDLNRSDAVKGYVVLPRRVGGDRNLVPRRLRITAKDSAACHYARATALTLNVDRCVGWPPAPCRQRETLRSAVTGAALKIV